MPRNPENERWWCEFEHPVYGTVQVVFGWRRVTRGVYRVEAKAVEFDMFTPMEEQQALMGLLEGSKLQVTAVGDE